MPGLVLTAVFVALAIADARYFVGVLAGAAFLVFLKSRLKFQEASIDASADEIQRRVLAFASQSKWRREQSVESELRFLVTGSAVDGANTVTIIVSDRKLLINSICVNLTLNGFNQELMSKTIDAIASPANSAPT